MPQMRQATAAMPVVTGLVTMKHADETFETDSDLQLREVAGRAIGRNTEPAPVFHCLPVVLNAVMATGVY